MLFHIQANFPNTGRFFGGDLNKLPWSLGGWYNAFNGADYSSSSVSCNANFSDHCFLAGEFSYPISTVLGQAIRLSYARG